MRNIVLIVHDIRSCHNVGSLLRTAEGLGVSRVWLTGYTPYPQKPNDTRIPHVARKIDAQIHKTALGAETWVKWEQNDEVMPLLKILKDDGFEIVGLEQAKASIKLPDFNPPKKIAILLGREVDGLKPELINECSVIVEIPMFGSKESFNVVQAAAMMLYHCQFFKS